MFTILNDAAFSARLPVLELLGVYEARSENETLIPRPLGGVLLSLELMLPQIYTFQACLEHGFRVHDGFTLLQCLGLGVAVLSTRILLL